MSSLNITLYVFVLLFFLVYCSSVHRPSSLVSFVSSFRGKVEEEKKQEQETRLVTSSLESLAARYQVIINIAFFSHLYVAGRYKIWMLRRKSTNCTGTSSFIFPKMTVHQMLWRGLDKLWRLIFLQKRNLCVDPTQLWICCYVVHARTNCIVIVKEYTLHNLLQPRCFFTWQAVFPRENNDYCTTVFLFRGKFIRRRCNWSFDAGTTTKKIALLPRLTSFLFVMTVFRREQNPYHFTFSSPILYNMSTQL